MLFIIFFEGLEKYYFSNKVRAVHFNVEGSKGVWEDQYWYCSDGFLECVEGQLLYEDPGPNTSTFCDIKKKVSNVWKTTNESLVKVRNTYKSKMTKPKYLIYDLSNSHFFRYRETTCAQLRLPEPYESPYSTLLISKYTIMISSMIRSWKMLFGK